MSPLVWSWARRRCDDQHRGESSQAAIAVIRGKEVVVMSSSAFKEPRRNPHMIRRNRLRDDVLAVSHEHPKVAFMDHAAASTVGSLHDHGLRSVPAQRGHRLTLVAMTKLSEPLVGNTIGPASNVTVTAI